MTQEDFKAILLESADEALRLLRLMKYAYGVDRENPVEVWTWTDGILDAIIRRNLKPKLIEAGRNQFTGEKMKKT